MKQDLDQFTPEQRELFADLANERQRERLRTIHILALMGLSVMVISWFVPQSFAWLKTMLTIGMCLSVVLAAYFCHRMQKEEEH